MKYILWLTAFTTGLLLAITAAQIHARATDNALGFGVLTILALAASFTVLHDTHPKGG